MPPFPDPQPHGCPELPDAASGDKDEHPNDSCPVVGIGASAGGLEAFTHFLQNLPANTGMAFVLVQHLDPHHESMLAEILAGHTAMPLKQAIHGLKVESDHVYVIPPNTTMAIQRGTLQLTPRGESRLRHLPIDAFLCSLAHDQKSRSIGVILSGSASDGTLGLKAIKDAGGITFAQDGTAAFDSMPRNAVAAGAVDFVLPPGEIAREISAIANHAYLEAASPSDLVEEGPALQAIFAVLRNAKNVDFTHYKAATIRRRLCRRMALRQKNDIGSYLHLLRQDPREVNALFDDLLIRVTEFFRDPGVFEVLSKTVFSVILKHRKGDDPIRIWIPGCSSGEEVYSIAICLSEYLEQTRQSAAVKIFGTDVSDRAVETARAGKYTAAITSVVSPERMNRYFMKLDNGDFQITRSIREQCVFSRHDLTSDPPLSRMDLISCRNLLIYLGTILQRRVLATFSYALQPTGCLILGASESLGSLAEYFLELDRDHKVYSRNLRLLQPRLHSDRAVPRAAVSPGSHEQAKETVNLLDIEANRLVSDDYGPSGFLVDATFRVVTFRGDVGAYVAAPNGIATLDIFRLVREDLLPIVRSALEESAARDSAVRNEHVPMSRNGQTGEINVVVRPVGRFGTERHFLVLFEEQTKQNSRELAQLRHSDPASSRDLSEELASTRAYLQALIEELRTANEEAQSANEELQSTNEELQTSKEELQSSNEELITTNEEMQSRNSELSQVNNDLINLLSSMRAPIVMLNKELRIRRFTPFAEKTLNLIATDIGRPITDLKPRIDVPDLAQLLAKVIYSVTALEQEVQDQEGRWYSMRINPYRTSDNQVEGAVLQLLDIDQLKRTLEAAQQARSDSDAIFETVREPLVVLDSNLRVQTANHSFFETFAVSPEDTLNQSIFQVGGRQFDSPNVHQVLDDLVASKAIRLHDLEMEHNLESQGLRTFQLNARLLRREGDERRILLAVEDVTERKRAAEAKYRRLFETAKDGILMIDAESGNITDANAYLLNLFGHSRQELVGQPFWQAGPLSVVHQGPEMLKKLLAEEMVRLPELSVQAADGRTIDVEAIGNMYSEGEKRVIQFNIRDITKRKVFDSNLRESAKLESLGLLAGGIAHDFNNLLTGIMGNASLLLDNSEDLRSSREFLREIVKATQRAADLTRQMLAYSGRGRFVVEPVDLSELVLEISALVKSSIPKSVDIDLNLADQLPPIEADATQMRQVVMNLLINGAEAYGDRQRGSVRVTTRVEQLDATCIRDDHSLTSLKPGTFVVLEVADNGSGMDEATKAKIFDPFFTTKFTGRGLGLSAVLGIVKGHRGSIRVDSALGRGTTFKLLFPASSAKIRKARSPRAEDLRGTGRVLVVDDEDAVLKLAKPALERYGYKVSTASNGEAAVQLVRERGSELALVILDLTMPVMDGKEALGHMKAIAPDLPVVLSSGYDQRQAVEGFGEYTLAGFIQKPYSVRELLKTVKSVLG